MKPPNHRVARNLLPMKIMKPVYIFLIWIAVAALAFILLSWGWHLAAPQRFHFLSPEQHDALKNVLLGAALAAFVFNHTKKVL